MVAELTEKADVLNAQMMSVWEFVSDNQDLINYDSEGNYEFKRLHCSLVGMSIGNIFSRKTDYQIHYSCPTPRNPLNKADEFEQTAFDAFKQNENLEKYCAIAPYEGIEAFRYAAPMRIEESCLQCHGGSKGEIDILGYDMECMQLGDLYGTVSMIIPLEAYREGTNGYIAQEAVLCACALTACLAVIWLLLTGTVTKPIERLRLTAKHVAEGEWDVDVSQFKSKDEIQDLANDLQHMAKQLQSVYEGLESEVENRTEALSEANRLLEEKSQELQRANARLLEDSRYKSNFLSTVSHELRTPLTAIIAFSSQLQKSPNADTARLAHLAEKINASSQILLVKVNNILEVARLDTGRVKASFEFVDAVDMLYSVEDILRPIAEEKHIAFSVYVATDTPLVEGDPDMLHSIVENLVSNALKFTPEGGSVSLRAFLCEKELGIEVADSGPGIAKDEEESIFEQFTQSDSSISRKHGGSGLGLYLVKAYTQIHKGSVSVQSSPGRGATFLVRIPVSQDNE